MANREIKFRAWHEETKTMHQSINPFRWDFVISNSWHRCEKSTGNGLLGSGSNEAEMLVPAVRYDNLMQYTGLKDKNGTEIYEGDIYKVANNQEYIVKWCDSMEARNESYYACFILWMNEDTFFPFDEFAVKEGKLIGNIYEHPELLN